MKLSIVIPCADDTRIKNCIESIDEVVEIIAVLNSPTEEVEKIVDGFDIDKIVIKERNLAKALNVGIEESNNSKVVLIDSDCTFRKGAIRKIFEESQGHLITNGKVIFEKNGFSSTTIANFREYIYYDPPKPYNPFLCIDKDLKKYVGGYYFDESIRWTEDAELYIRLKEAGISAHNVFDAEVVHPPLSMVYDLRSAFRYGTGRKLRTVKGNEKGPNTHFNNVSSVMDQKGFLTGLYYFFWNISYLLGYLSQDSDEYVEEKGL